MQLLRGSAAGQAGPTGAVIILAAGACPRCACSDLRIKGGGENQEQRDKERASVAGPAARGRVAGLTEDWLVRRRRLPTRLPGERAAPVLPRG